MRNKVSTALVVHFSHFLRGLLIFLSNLRVNTLVNRAPEFLFHAVALKGLISKNKTFMRNLRERCTSYLFQRTWTIVELRLSQSRKFLSKMMMMMMKKFFIVRACLAKTVTKTTKATLPHGAHK